MRRRELALVVGLVVLLTAVAPPSRAAGEISPVTLSPSTVYPVVTEATLRFPLPRSQRVRVGVWQYRASASVPSISNYVNASNLFPNSDLPLTISGSTATFSLPRWSLLPASYLVCVYDITSPTVELAWRASRYPPYVSEFPGYAVDAIGCAPLTVVGYPTFLDGLALPATAVVGQRLSTVVRSTYFNGTSYIPAYFAMTLSVGGSTWNGYPQAPDGVAGITFTAPAQPGTYQVVAKTGLLGSWWAPSAPLTRTLVVTPLSPPPSPPTVSVTPVRSSVNSRTASWSTPASTVGIGSYDFRYDGGGYVYSTTATSICCGLSSSYGTHTIEVRARDKTGQVSGWSAPVSFTWDRPTALSLLSALPAVLDSGRTYGVSAYVYSTTTPVPGAVLELAFEGRSVTAVTDASGKASAVVTVTSGFGPVTLTVRAQSTPLGFASPSPASQTAYVQDRVAPVVSVAVSPPSSATNPFRAVWSANDVGSGIGGFTYSLDGGPELSLTAQTSQLTFNAPSRGTHVLQIRAVDRAGNSAVSQARFELAKLASQWTAEATVQASCVNGIPTGTYTIAGRLLDANNVGIQNQTVSIAGGRLPGSALTDLTGSVRFAGQSGSTFTLSYAGDINYTGSTKQVVAPAQPPCATPPPPPPPPPPSPPPVASPPPIAGAGGNLTVDIPVR